MTDAINALICQLDQVLASVDETPHRLVRLQTDRPILFVGDIHGDNEAVQAVLARFPPPEHVIVFLGDIVDRGPDSCAALSAIVRAKLDEPGSIHLLMGNHEARGVSTFRPANFWRALSQEHSEHLARHLLKLPLAAWHPEGLLASHGGLPDLASVDAIDDIELGSEAWRALVWGDWVSNDHHSTQRGSRPAFGPSEFDRRCTSLGIRTLVRSHQPTAPTFLFQDRCLTLFTSSCYGRGARQIARWTPSSRTQTARDFELLTV